MTAAAQAGDIILTVNQDAVCRDEFVFFLDQERNGTSPRELLLKRTVARVTREKVRQQLFQELGLLPATSFPDLLAQLEKLNREREQAVKDGRVIYGPVRLTPLQYYGDWMAKLELQAKEILAAGRLAMTDTELRAWYRKNRDLFRTRELSDWEIVTVRRESAPTSAVSADAVGQLANLIYLRVNRGANPEQICRELGDHAGVVVTIERPTRTDTERVGEQFAGVKDPAALNQLKPGRCRRLDYGPDRIQIVRCVSRTRPTLRPFETVATMVRRKLLDQKYAALVEELIRQAEVKINRATLESLPVE